VSIIRKVSRRLPLIRRVYRVARVVFIIHKINKMGDKGYINAKREKKLAKALDGFFDFRKMLGNRKLLFGIINVGNTLERNDYGIFLTLIRVLDDGIIGKNMNIQAAAVLDRALTFLEEKDLDGFNDYVSGVLAGKIDIPLINNDKLAFLAVLNAMKSLLNLAIDRFNQAVASAENELKNNQ